MENLRDAPAVHEFHEDVLAAVGKRSGVGYRADVGTPQARRGAAFLKEAVRDGLVCRGIGQERLQREVLVEAEVRDLVHNAHASAADQPDNAELVIDDVVGKVRRHGAEAARASTGWRRAASALHEEMLKDSPIIAESTLFKRPNGF